MAGRVRRLLSLILAALVGSAVTALALGPRPAPSPVSLPKSLADSPDFARFVAVYQDIRAGAIWPTSPARLLTGAINGMVGSLGDPFSDYLPPAAYAALNQQLGASFGGIGVALGETGTGRFQIVAVFPGTPAARAGLVPDTEIVAVNGHPVAGLSPEAVADEIRGPVGSRLTLTVLEHGLRRSLALRRAVIELPTVSTAVLPGHLGYLQITEFGYRTGPAVLAAYRRLVRAGVRGIVLDLRDNPGGDLAQCRIAAGAFVPRGPLVTLVYKGGARQRILSPGPGTRLPVVVLVNGDTASAAEILAAAIQERHVGLLVGTRTYGKGIVQELESLPGGAYLKLTVARYLTPDGLYIEHRGLEPNVLVPEPPGVTPSDVPRLDPQLARAVAVLSARLR
jgi:carboxyl-terminal processing protease